MRVKVNRLNDSAVVPKYAHEYDSGFDLVAAEDVIVEPGETSRVRTGLAFELPQGYEMQIRPRSGITLKTKLRVQFGTVDAGYRGEVGVIVDNASQSVTEVTEDGELYEPKHNYVYLVDGGAENTPRRSYVKRSYLIRKGDRIAQAVVKPVEHAELIEVDDLGETSRGQGGFGSSGVS